MTDVMQEQLLTYIQGFTLHAITAHMKQECTHSTRAGSPLA